MEKKSYVFLTKKIFVLFLAWICVLGMGACNVGVDTEHVKYSVDLSLYPTNEDCMGYGEIKEISDGKLLITPGSDKDKTTFGEVVWLISDNVEAYSVGQVVTYTFRNVQAPDNEGDPLKIIALLIYME